jgi:hypothetical protein
VWNRCLTSCFEPQRRGSAEKKCRERVKAKILLFSARRRGSKVWLFMRTIYIYLSWTGWIWFVIAGTYLILKLKSKQSEQNRRGFPVVQEHTEAKQSNEQ